MQFCTNCGTLLPSGGPICPTCGQKIFDTSSSSRSVETKTVAGSYGPPPMQYQSLSPQKELSRTTTILLGVLALLVMSSGFGLIYYTTVAHPAQLQAQATTTVQTILTSNAQSRVQATGTAQALVHATATSQAIAQATSTALQSIYTSSTSGTPVLNSSLAFQDGNGWDLYDAVGGGGCHFSGGALHSSIFQKNFYVPCFAQTTNFGNFAFQVLMTITQGDEGGLIFRANDIASRFYYFRVARDGTYGLNISKDEKNSTPLIEDNNSAIKTALGQPNLLTVVAQGSNIYLYINKQFVGSTNDNRYGAGKIGIFAGNNGNATDVAFTNAQVWTL